MLVWFDRCQDNLLLEAEWLTAECKDTRGWAASDHPLVVRVGNNIQQLGHTFAPDRRNDPKLRKMRPDRVDCRSLLVDEEMTGAVKASTALLLRCLGRHEPHVGSGDRLPDSLCVSHVVLLPLYIGFHVAGGISRTVCPSA